MPFKFKFPKWVNVISLFWGIYIPLVILGYYNLFVHIFDKAK